MPVYNASKFLEVAIESVVSQTYRNWELLIVDDASTDNSSQIVEIFSNKDPRIKSVKLTTNQGPDFCRNTATEMAKGDFIAFLDSDDAWASQKLEIQVGFMLKSNCDVSFTNYIHIDENGNSLHKRVKARPLLPYRKQFLNNYIGNLTGIYQTESLGKLMSPSLPKRQDWALWLEAIKRSGRPAIGIQQDLAFYRVRKDSVSANKIGLLKHNFNFYRNHLGYSSMASLYFMCLFLWEYFVERPKFIERVD